jgi:hypothetical protein
LNHTSAVAPTLSPPPARQSFGALRNPGYRAQFLTYFLAMMADNIEHVISYWVVFQKFHSPALAGWGMGRCVQRDKDMTATDSATISSDQATPATLRLGDLRVGRLGFGAMRTGRGIWGPPADRAAAVRLLRRAVELGVTFIDTADSYGPGVSEELIAEALAPYRDGLVIATKGGLTRPGPGEWRRDGRPAHLRAACEASLKRLRTDRIDLYQLHSPDPRVPLDDSIGALVELQGEGKIRHIGISNVDVNELAAARRVATIV